MCLSPSRAFSRTWLRAALALCAALTLTISAKTPLAQGKPPSVENATAETPRVRRAARDHFDYYFELGPTFGRGGPFRLPNHSGPRMAGLRLTERNGFIGRGTTNALYVALASMSVSDREYQGSTYYNTSYATYRVDHYRMLSQAEIDAQYQAIEETSQALMGSAHDGFDVTLYHPALGGDAIGFTTHVYFAGTRQFKHGVQRRFVLRVGLGGGFVRGEFADLERRALGSESAENDDWRWWSVSTPVQALYAPSSWLTFTYEWDLNWAALVYLVNAGYERRSADPASQQYGRMRYAPMRLSATVSPVDFLFVSAAAELGSFSADGLGWSAGAGVRF